MNDEEYWMNANLQLQPITENNLTKIVFVLRLISRMGGSAPGSNNILALFIKHVFNDSVKNGVFPEIF